MIRIYLQMVPVIGSGLIGGTSRVSGMCWKMEYGQQTN
jgi:hypothetical protein